MGAFVALFGFGFLGIGNGDRIGADQGKHAGSGEVAAGETGDAGLAGIMFSKGDHDTVTMGLIVPEGTQSIGEGTI